MFYSDPFSFGSYGSSFGSPYERASRRRQQELARRRIIEEERRRRAEYEQRQREEEKMLRQQEQRRREKERTMVEKMKTRFGKSSKKQVQPNLSSGSGHNLSSASSPTVTRPKSNFIRSFIH